MTKDISVGYDRPKQAQKPEQKPDLKKDAPEIAFVPLDSYKYPSDIKPVMFGEFTEENGTVTIKAKSFLDEFTKKYGAELQWCIKTLTKRDGYGIALPMIGIPLNAAIFRWSVRDPLQLVFNMGYIPYKDKGMSQSKEADYILANAKVLYEIPRWRKIKASWFDGEERREKVLRYSPKAKTIKVSHRGFRVNKVPTAPEAVLWQNLSEHMSNTFVDDFISRARYDMKHRPIERLP